MESKGKVMVVLVVMMVVVMVCLQRGLPSLFYSKINTYLGFQQTNASRVRVSPDRTSVVSRAISNMNASRVTAKQYVRKQSLEDYLEERAIRVSEVNCRKVLDGDQDELKKANAAEHHPFPMPRDADILTQASSNCSRFVQQNRFLTNPLTSVEEQFPIAFSLLVFKQASQVVDLLRAIYRPQNWYCVHVDRKSPSDFQRALEAVSRCFPNVFMASRSVDVRWGFFTVLEPEVVCMEDLWRKGGRWRYFINLTGQEFPLRTNYELVRILSAYRGANDVAGAVPPSSNLYRWQRYLPAPHNITMYKGAAHIVVSRAFVDYVLHSPIAQDFLRWCRPTLHPDEHFFNSLNRNLHLRIPGSSSVTDYRPTMARYKNWVPTFPCPGQKVVRGICILNILDLPRLNTRQELFANKFYADYSRLALQCLAEELHNRTRDQTLGRLKFNVSFYEQLPFVVNSKWL